MRKIIIYITAIILLAILSNSVHAQSFGNVGLWDIYSIPAGRVVFGAGDKTTKPDTSAALEIRGRKRALYLRGVVSRDSVYSPKPGMIVMDSTDYHIYFRSASSWIRLDSIGGGSAPDSSIFLTVTDAAATYQPIGSYLTSETDPLSLHLTDTSSLLANYLRKSDTASLSARIDLKENAANKAPTMGVLNNTLFPTTKAVSDYVTGLGYQTMLNAGYAITGIGGGVISVDTTKIPNYRLSDSIAASKVAQTVTNSVTTSCPSQDATYDFATNASNLLSGTVGTARLGSGTANSTTYLRGDQTWATITSGSTVSGGSIQFSGDGVTNQFNIPHGISGTPTKISVIPGSQAASAAHWVLSISATNIVIRFSGPPAGGINNITFYWTATP